MGRGTFTMNSNYCLSVLARLTHLGLAMLSCFILQQPYEKGVSVPNLQIRKLMHARLVNPGKVTPLWLNRPNWAQKPFNLTAPLEETGLMDSLVSPGVRCH